LLVVLHGDDGNTSWMEWIWHRTTDNNGVVLVLLRCPGAGGYGDPSWSRWQRSGHYDAGWLAARIGDVTAAHPIEARRIYAAGYSSGATYLSRATTEQPQRFAALSLVAGGTRPVPSCPACKLPVRFLVGSLDTMLKSDVAPLRDWYEACGGHEVVWQERVGMTHEGILWDLEHGEADAVMKWMLGHEANCGG
jgi:poly(3-hydroxybutyrate) depolymerase